MDKALHATMDEVLTLWPYVVTLLNVVLSMIATGHAVLSPPPFDHTKLLLVDGLWNLLGSANWDPRSLRLNFEFNVEYYDVELATLLTGLVRSKIEQSRPLSTADMDGRSLPVRLRDGVARLFSPYL